MFIKKIILIIFLISNIIYNFNKSFTILINPAGDTNQDNARTINDSFEKNITLQFSTELKNYLELSHPGLRVILTRSNEDIAQNLQNANFANQLNVNFYLSVHFYKENETVPRIFLYYYLAQNFYIKPISKLAWHDFDSANLMNIDKTIYYADKFTKSLKNNNNLKVKYNFINPIGIPFKSLIGIKSPSMAIEIGLKNSNDFKNYIEPIKQALEQIINE